MLDWAPTIGILIGFVLVVAYCYAGGIRASIWTDAAQSSVMIVGSTILCLVALNSSGGFSGSHNELAKPSTHAMVNVFPSGLKFWLQPCGLLPSSLAALVSPDSLRWYHGS